MTSSPFSLATSFPERALDSSFSTRSSKTGIEPKTRTETDTMATVGINGDRNTTETFPEIVESVEGVYQSYIPFLGGNPLLPKLN